MPGGGVDQGLGLTSSDAGAIDTRKVYIPGILTFFVYTVLLTFDFDAYAPWIYRKMANYTNLSRGEFAALGVRRILGYLKETGLVATFFVPGHTAEHFPEETGMIRDAGHEIASHGYLHEPPEGLTEEEERHVLDRGMTALKNAVNVRPKGYRSPSWALTKHTMTMLQQRGYIYDSSLMSTDYTPYIPALYEEALDDGRVVKGPLSNMAELPVSWSLDDYPHFEYSRLQGAIQPGLRSVNEVFENWSLDFDYMVRMYDEGVYVLTMHPEVIGRGHRMILLERLIGHIRGNGRAKSQGLEFARCADAAKRYLDGWGVTHNEATG